MRWTEKEKILLEYGRILDNIALLQKRIKGDSFDTLFTKELCNALLKKAIDKRLDFKKRHKVEGKSNDK